MHNLIDKKFSVKEFKLFYNNYIKELKPENKIQKDAIKEKIKHSYDVASQIVKLGKTMKVSESELTILFIIGLYHDIGRYKQLLSYDTFDDKEIDHGDLGAEIVTRLSIFKNMRPELKNIIVIAIKEHNKKTLRKNKNNTTLFYCNMIRDADKLALFPFFIKNFSKFEQYFPCHDNDPNQFSREFVDFIILNKKFYFTDAKSLLDFKLYILSWMNNIFFKDSVDIILKNEYVKEILADFPCPNCVNKLIEHFNLEFRVS